MNRARRKKIDCPNCGTSLNWNAENPFRPFCSERCQQIDLGNWANEQYVIPGESLDAGEQTEEARPSEQKKD